MKISYNPVSSFLLLVCLSILALLPPASTAWSIQATPEKEIVDDSQAFYKRSHALVIGVSFYTRGWPPLPGVESDVKAITAVLKKQGFHVKVVKNPNQEELEDAFKDFILTYGLEPENRLLFYFAGHGYTHKPSYASDDPQEWMGYIVSREAPRPTGNRADFFRHAMSLERISNFALQIEAKHVLFMFDSCFSGSVFSQSRGVPPDIQERTARPVRQFITSGSADQEVPDTSIFRRQFVDALDGEADLNSDRFVTGSELGMFLQEKVTNYSRRSQTPQYGKIRHHRLDKGDFVFFLQALKEEKARPKARPQARKAPKMIPIEKNALEKQRRQGEAKRRLLAGRQELYEQSGRSAMKTFAFMYQPETPETEKQAPRPDTDRWAVVVGVGTHKDPDILGFKYADANARAVAEFLKSSRGGSYKGVRLLVNERATLDNLKDALDKYLMKAKANDMVLIYMAGSVVREPGWAGDAYFSPYDAGLTDLKSTALPLEEIARVVNERIQAGKVVLIADAPRFSFVDSLVGTAVLSASAVSEAPREGTAWGGGQGVFTYYLLEGLKGKADADKNGVVTVREAYDYTYQRVVKATKNHQHPELNGLFDNNIPLAVVE
jgi:uncharacterized caspase-like protein